MGTHLPTRLGVAIFSLLLCAGVSFAQTARQPQRPLTAREIAQRSFPSVVMLITKNADGKLVSLGSGFFVRADVIATNRHVIEEAGQVYVRVIGQKTSQATIKILAVDEEHDLALLKVEGLTAHPLSLGVSKVVVGDEVYAIGNPEGLEGTFSHGIVSALRGKDYIQITAPISHGSSGGPVLNRRGEVIGVASGTFEEGQNLNFAIPASHLSSLIGRMNTAGPLTVNPAPFPTYLAKQRELLRGLRGMKVTIESLDPDAEKDGLSAYQLQADVELKLRKAGIPVFSEQEWLAAPGTPYLYVNVNTMKHNMGLYAYSLRVTLNEEAIPRRRSSVCAHVVTWESGRVGSVGAANLRSGLRDVVGEAIDDFINDYLAVNSK